MTATNGKPCASCETGTVRTSNLRGRTFDYRDDEGLLFNEDLDAPVCDSCGELYLKGELTQRFSDALERLRLLRKRAAGEHFVERIARDYPVVPRSMWEDAIGVSHGYLSRVATGQRVPGTLFEIWMEGFAREPEIALRLLEAAGRMPAQLSDALRRPRQERSLVQG